MRCIRCMDRKASYLDLRTVFKPRELQPIKAHTFSEGEFDSVRLKKGKQWLPRYLPLDEPFGFFVGAYLSDGWATDTGTVGISNVDPEFRKHAAQWPLRWGMHVAEYRQNGRVTGVTFSATIVSELLRRTCGHGSWEKHVPTFAHRAPLSFARGVINGYWSGDGSVGKLPRVGAMAESRSMNLLVGIAALLARVADVQWPADCSALVRDMPIHASTVEDNGHLRIVPEGDVEPLFRLYLRASGTRKMASRLKLSVKKKQDRLDAVLRSMSSKKKT